MPVTPRQLDIESALIQDAYQALEDELMKQLIDILMQATSAELSELTSREWMIEKLAQLNMLNMETIKRLVEANSTYTQEQLKKIIEDMGYKVVEEIDAQLTALTGSQVEPFSELGNVLNSYLNQQWMDLDNHINQTLITTNYANNTLVQKYQQILNDAVAKVLGGLMTPDKAIRQAIYESIEKGILSTFTDKAGHEWSIERYVRTVMKSITHRVYNDLRLKRSKDFGVVTALMSSHAAARKACAPIQGDWVLIVRKSEAPEEYRNIPSIYEFGYGDPSGTQGINCSHRLYPGIPGITENHIPKPPTPEQAAKNAETVSKQRRMETAIRNAKKQLQAAEQIGNTEDTEYFKQLVRKRQAALRSLIDEYSSLLHRDYSREQIYS